MMESLLRKKLIETSIFIRQVLSAKARFVKMVIEGKIVIRKRRKLILFDSA